MRTQQDRITDSELTPSARLIERLRSKEQSFFPYAMEVSRSYKEYYLSTPPHSDETLALISSESVASMQRQRQIEAHDQQGFDEYIRDWFS